MRKINEERLKAFINATREDAEEASSLNRTSIYSFDFFCKQNGLYDKGMKEQSGGTVIHCPFHKDFDPSCSLNDSKGWKCFSCGRGGSYWNFVYLYHTEVLGERVTQYQLMQKALQNDISLMNKLGFNSLYTSEKKFPKEIDVVKRKRFVYKGDQPQTYLELQTKLVKNGMTKEQIKKFILLAQSGVSVDKVSEELKRGVNGITKKYNLDEMGVFK